MEIPESVKMMDSGMARIQSRNLTEAAGKVTAALLRTQGKVERVSEADLVLNCTSLWRYRFISAHIEPSLDGYAVSFQEANAPRTLFRSLLAGLLLLCAGAVLLLSPGSLWWRIPVLLAAILLYLYLYYAPSKRCQRKMEGIIRELNHSDLTAD